MTVLHFIDYKYLPWVRQKKKPSTIKGYVDIFENHIRSRVGGIRLRDFRTVDAQRILDDIDQNQKLSHRSLIHIKSFLSGGFSFAKRIGAFDGANPLQGRGTVIVGGHNNTEDTYAYSLDEILKMLDVLVNETYRTLVLVAAFEGLSLSELRGLRWQDVGKDEISVENTYWHEFEGSTKTQARKDKVPLLGVVAEALAQHQQRNPLTKYVFESPIRAHQPLDLASVGKHIKESLTEAGSKWAGWHSFRRGLASNLSELDIKDTTIQAILRHANVSVTQQYYIKQRSAGSAKAMAKLERVIRKKRPTLVA
jgi:integrase